MVRIQNETKFIKICPVCEKIGSRPKYHKKYMMTYQDTPDVIQRTDYCDGDHEGSEIQTSSPSADADLGKGGRGHVPLQASSIPDHASGNTLKTRGNSQQSPTRR